MLELYDEGTKRGDEQVSGIALDWLADRYKILAAYAEANRLFETNLSEAQAWDKLRTLPETAPDYRRYEGGSYDQACWRDYGYMD
jgi:hypothetical protein